LSIKPPSQPWSTPPVSQSTNSCSDKEINSPVVSLVIPSVAEYHALADTTSELLWLRWLLTDMGPPQTASSPLYCDN
jgi:hypothetical protein